MQEVPQETFKIETTLTVYTSGKNIFATSSQKTRQTFPDYVLKD